MSLTDYKAKYLDLKNKFMNTVDLSWRLGYEQGLKDAELDQMQQQQMQANAMVQQTAGQPPQPGEELKNPDEEKSPGMESQNPNGDELDQHIAKLEGMLGKSEITGAELEGLKKTLNDIRSLQVQMNLAKSMDSIKNTKMGHKDRPLIITPKLQANLPEQSRQALSMQKKIVDDIFSKWEKDETKAAHDINSIIGIEGITKKD